MISDFENRILRKNHATGVPSRCIFFDTETKTRRTGKIEKHRMKMAWLCHARYNKVGQQERVSWKYFEDTLELCKAIASSVSQKSTVYLFAHNAFFDLQVSDFYYYFTRWGWELEFNYEKGLTYILAIKKGNRRLNVVSTTNYFDMPLKKIGDLVGLKKLDVDFNKVKKAELKVYCHRDVEIIKKAMEMYFDFIIKHDLGKFSFTRAAQAFRAYRHRFMGNRVYLHKDEEVKALERFAYFGGRVECFELGNIQGGPFISLDVNSMYPFVMKLYPVPVRINRYMKDVPVEWIKRFLVNYALVAEVTVETSVPLYPVRMNKKLVFPIGKFKAFMCSHSLFEAIERDDLVEVHRLAVYDKAHIFDQYVDYFHSLRNEYKDAGNKVFDRYCKYFLNSFYGKFGQKAKITEVTEDKTNTGYYRMEIYNMVKNRKEMEYKLFNKHIIEVDEVDGKNSFCAIAAHVTDAARVMLWKIIEGIGPDRVLYCDTDSIKIRASDLNRVKYPIDETKLGALKIEERFNKFEILGPKSYITEKIRKLKGVPVSAELLDHHRYKYMTFLKQSSHMKQQVTRYLITRETIKEPLFIYDKGVVGKDNRITPFLLQ